MKLLIFAASILLMANAAFADNLKLSNVQCATSQDGKYVMVSGDIENSSKQLVQHFNVTPYLVDKFSNKINAPATTVTFNDLKPWNSYNFVAKVKMTVNEYDGCSASINRL